MEKLITRFQYLTVLLLFLNILQLEATPIYVNSLAVGSNNGTSWANAFTRLSDALSTSVSGDEIWVAQGIYKPVTIVDINSNGVADPREATFQIPSGVMLYGGFTGTETLREERNWVLNPTVLSGDIDNNDTNTDGNGIAETTTDIQGNNAYHVIYTANVTANTRIDGFIITAGCANVSVPVNDPNRHGGGWYNQLISPTNASSPTIVNTIFIGNYAKSKGGAIYNKQSSAGAEIISMIENCKFIDNKSDSAGGAIFMGSYLPGTYQPHLIKCEFTGNIAYRNGGAITMIGDRAIIDSSVFKDNIVTVISMGGTTLPGSGGGVILIASNATFNGCMFENNKATGNPTGAFEGGGGGAVYITTNDPQTTSLGASEPKFIGCGFYNNIASDNTSAWGGAIVHLSDAGILHPHYVNCVFYGNTAQTNGGAVASFTRIISAPASFSSILEPQYTNCTFARNHANQRGGALYNAGYLFMGTEILESRVENCILWDNSADTEGPEIFKTGNNTVAYSLIKGSGGSGGGWISSFGTDAGNNIDVDPLFTNEANPNGVDNIPATIDDGLTLSTSSPALNVGINSAAGLSGIGVDYTGNIRVRNSIVDLGAYEKNYIILPKLNIYWLKDWRFERLCPSCPPPWAILFYDIEFQQFRWASPAYLVDDGKTAIITGTMASVKNKKAKFNVHIKLENPQDWSAWSSKQRSYFTLSPEVWKLAFINHKDWNYWELSDESYLEGSDDIAGKLYLKHHPSNFQTGFQLGVGANGLDKDTGLNGCFSYLGTIVYKGKKIYLKGLGSMNVDAGYCLDCDTLMPQKSTIFEDYPENLNEEPISPETDFEVFPVPASDYVFIWPKMSLQAELIVNVYDMNGQLKKQNKIYSNDGYYMMRINDLKSGVYVIKLTLPDGTVINKRLIVQ